ncbi:MAG: hypothetical protein IT236_12015 [Bacteroidia bacterium]|nr:hypothetical protein [Bacteroidia bacterium]
MKTNYTHLQQPNLKLFYEFAKMNNSEKTNILHNKAVLLDNDIEKEEAVNLYYLNGFFVEETISAKKGGVVDIIPYKHGYRLETYATIVPTIVRKKNSYFK